MRPTSGEFGADHRLHDADLVGRRVDLVALVLARKLELLEIDHALERRRLALEDEDVAGLEQRVAGRLVAARAAAMSVITSTSPSPSSSSA